MNYAYIRVSTGGQTVENQRFEINNWCKKKDIAIDVWVEEVVSGAKEPENRKFGKLLKKLKPDDVLICTEISRIGRSLFMIMDIFKNLMQRNIKFYTVKEGFTLDDSINSKVCSFAFGLAADIERTLISQRTKEALALRVAQGVKLGRPEGSKNFVYKLDAKRDYIIKRLTQGKTRYYICQHLKIHFDTLNNYLERQELMGLVKVFSPRSKLAQRG